MITRLSHSTIFVSDQDKAYNFYVNILGFKVHTDATMENGFRWLTIVPPNQPNIQVTLLNPVNPFMNKDEEVRKAFQLLLDKQALGAGVLETTDCKASYAELKAKGVNFKSEPKEQFYGIEAVVEDGCGNWFSLTEPKEA
jgi:catechol 2,3-dioxygenase-like lactoylglutathione lyase family enzyme